MSSTRDPPCPHEQALWFRESQRVAHIGGFAANFVTGRVALSELAYEVMGVGPDFPHTVEAWVDLVVPGDRAEVLAYFEEVVRERRSIFEREYHLRRPSDGKVRCVAGLAKMSYDADGSVSEAIGTIQDVTERREHERERRLLEARLAQVQKLESLGSLAGGMAHDFNNLLGGLLGFVELARAESTPGSEIAELLDRALEISHRARNLTEQLLTFARGGAPEVRAARLEQLLQDRVAFALGGSNVAARFELPADLPACLYDAVQLGRAIDNLVINAKQAMPEGGVLDVSVRRRRLALHEHPVLTAGDWVEVSFTDHGPGIPQDVLPRIFEPFFTTKSLGSGLGLATAYSILRRHSGFLEVDSVPGEGATFRFFLPATEGPRASLAPKAKRADGVGTSRVLVMDDEETLRAVLARMLKRLGCEVVLAPDSVAAKARYAEARSEGKPFSALILDLTIPGGPGGKDLLADLQKEGDQTPALAVSGYSDDPVMAHPGDYGFLESLAKPFTIAALEAVLARLIPA